MNDEQIKQAVQDFASSVEEVISTLRSVKGSAFAEAVAAAFEARQAIECAGFLVQMTEDPQADMLGTNLVHLIASIAAKASHSLSDDEVKEVLKTADSLFDRRQQTLDRVNGA